MMPEVLHMVLTEGFQDIRKSEAEDFCKEINEKAGDYQLIVEKYKIFNWKEYFDIVDYLDEHDISYIVYA